jgi:hypothetical protein
MFLRASLRNRSVSIGLLAVLVSLASANIMAANPDVAMDAPRLTKWFCDNLKAPFDFANAVKTFPFEKLGDIDERDPKPNDDNTAVSIDFVAAGKHFTVEFGYQRKLGGSSQPYGYDLSVRAKRDYDVDPTLFPKEWLSTLGKPKYNVTGYAVGFGPPMFAGGPTLASFSYWDTGSIRAAWLHEDDIEKFAEPCAKVR